jgi:hypothetical protein
MFVHKVYQPIIERVKPCDTSTLLDDVRTLSRKRTQRAETRQRVQLEIDQERQLEELSKLERSGRSHIHRVPQPFIGAYEAEGWRDLGLVVITDKNIIGHIAKTDIIIFNLPLVEVQGDTVIFGKDDSYLAAKLRNGEKWYAFSSGFRYDPPPPDKTAPPDHGGGPAEQIELWEMLQYVPPTQKPTDRSLGDTHRFRTHLNRTEQIMDVTNISDIEGNWYYYTGDSPDRPSLVIGNDGKGSWTLSNLRLYDLKDMDFNLYSSENGVFRFRPRFWTGDDGRVALIKHTSGIEHLDLYRYNADGKFHFVFHLIRKDILDQIRKKEKIPYQGHTYLEDRCQGEIKRWKELLKSNNEREIEGGGKHKNTSYW